jgi:hypothetical protein
MDVDISTDDATVLAVNILRDSPFGDSYYIDLSVSQHYMWPAELLRTNLIR